MNRKIYRNIARRHGISVAEVKREMQGAIDETYRNPTALARSICGAGGKPTVDEFIGFVARRIKAGEE